MSDWWEAPRYRAWELKQQGWKQKDIATALGITVGTVSQWIKRGREQGVAAIQTHPVLMYPHASRWNTWSRSAAYYHKGALAHVYHEAA